MLPLSELHNSLAPTYIDKKALVADSQIALGSKIFILKYVQADRFQCFLRRVLRQNFQVAIDEA